MESCIGTFYLLKFDYCQILFIPPGMFRRIAIHGKTINSSYNFEFNLDIFKHWSRFINLYKLTQYLHILLFRKNHITLRILKCNESDKKKLDPEIPIKHCVKEIYNR